MMNLSFYKGKRVLITGNTGFKGTWLSKMLVNAGADVTGYALSAPTVPNLFELSGLAKEISTVIADIRDFDKLLKVFNETKPEIVFHLAAQPIVREGYRKPLYTYETNVMGTVNLLECIRLTSNVKSVVNITTDKVYKNIEQKRGYNEEESLDGSDPYSNSKSCSELVTHAYVNSFFPGGNPAVSTARAGNVIGGGDFALDRIIPDCVRHVSVGETIPVRNPYSVRPYQYVLEPLMVYLEIAEKQFFDSRYAGYYNVGPDDDGCVMTGDLVRLFCKYWGEGSTWESKPEVGAPHEANFLKLDCSRLKSVFGWRQKRDIEKSVEHTVLFYKGWLTGANISAAMDKEIVEFLKG